jgi:hypothetical protein
MILPFFESLAWFGGLNRLGLAQTLLARSLICGALSNPSSLG